MEVCVYVWVVTPELLGVFSGLYYQLKRHHESDYLENTNGEKE